MARADCCRAGPGRGRIRARALVVLLAVASAGLDAAGQTTFLAAEEQIEFFPADAVHDEERDVWLAPVHAVVFEPEHDAAARRALLAALASSLNLPPSSPGSPVFAERAAAFLPDREQDVRLVLDVAGQTVRVDPSGKDGHVHGTVEIPGPVVRVLPASEQEWLTLELSLPVRAAPRASGSARLLPAEGLSVISDVGDTVLVAEAKDRKRLLERIFLRELEPVAGMAELYARCAQDDGAAFHYISSGPWQLHAPLTRFLAEAGYPRGPLLLRELQTQETEPQDWFDDDPRLKRSFLARIATQWPGRRLILVGDSGEQNPELFGEAARRWPGQVERILIRDVTGEPRDAPRYEAAFRDVPGRTWTLFKEASELVSLRAPPEEPEALRPTAVPPLQPR